MRQVNEDFKPNNDKSGENFRVPPHNIEAEQALIGAILVNNAALDRVADIIDADHFFDPVHQDIFLHIESLITKGERATPITLKPFFPAERMVGDVSVHIYLVRLMANATSIINAPDYAKTIASLALRRNIILISEDTTREAYDICIDVSPQDIIDEIEAKLFALSDGGGELSHSYEAKQISEDAEKMLASAFQRKGGLSGLSTGFHELDEHLGGLAPSDLIILAGRPAMGKSGLASNIAFNVARNILNSQDAPPENLGDESSRGGQVSIYSLEMSAPQIMIREIARETGIPCDRLRRGLFNDVEYRDRIVHESQRLGMLPLHIDATGGLKISQLVTRARRRKRLYNTKLIVIDYLQLMSSGRNRDNRAAEVTEITTALKGLAKELDIPILALSQLSRQVENREDKRPQLSDLRESGSIEQDADIVIFVYRDEYYLERLSGPGPKDDVSAWELRKTEAKGVAEIITGKQRHGPIGTVQLRFDSKTASFDSMARPRKPISNNGVPI